MADPAPTLSVIVPAYNEIGRIEPTLRSVCDHLAERAEPVEVIVVDDGSDDGTADAVCALAAALPVPLRVLRYRPNRGKGYALKVGFAAARGDWLLFTDADLSVPIEQADELLDLLAAGADIAIGTRKLPEAEIVTHQPWYRERMGHVFTFIARRLYTDASDVTCGFKAFRGDAGRDLFARVRVFGWAYDAEVLAIARQQGLRIGEVPVRWEDKPGTKVRIVRDTIGSLAGLARILANMALGRYRTHAPADPATELASPGPSRAATSAAEHAP